MQKEITPARRIELAKICNVNPDYLWQCLTGRRSMRPERAVEFEKLTNGELSRMDLCQAQAGTLWPDLKAPEGDTK